MYKKKNPRTEFINIRVTKTEKKTLQDEALSNNQDFSDYVRAKLNLQ